MKYDFVSDYKENAVLRKSFNKLSEETFGINFEEWYQKDMWNDRYICFSFKKDNEIVANISINKVEFIVDGEIKKALQLGTVMVAENHRGFGLSKYLMQRVLEKYKSEYDIIYLFANNSVKDFYPKYGFQEKKQIKQIFNGKIEAEKDFSFRMLNMENEADIAIIKRLAKNRFSYSERFDVLKAEHIIHFYCNYIFPNKIYYNAENDVIVIFEQKDNRINLYNVIF